MNTALVCSIAPQADPEIAAGVCAEFLDILQVKNPDIRFVPAQQDSLFYPRVTLDVMQADAYAITVQVSVTDKNEQDKNEQTEKGRDFSFNIMDEKMTPEMQSEFLQWVASMPPLPV